MIFFIYLCNKTTQVFHALSGPSQFIGVTFRNRSLFLFGFSSQWENGTLNIITIPIKMIQCSRAHCNICLGRGDREAELYQNGEKNWKKLKMRMLPSNFVYCISANFMTAAVDLPLDAPTILLICSQF